MKHTYTKKEVMELFGEKSVSTFWRKQKKGIIPMPDLENKYSHTILVAKLPSLSTNPST